MRLADRCRGNARPAGEIQAPVLKTDYPQLMTDYCCSTCVPLTLTTDDRRVVGRKPRIVSYASYTALITYHLSLLVTGHWSLVTDHFRRLLSIRCTFQS